MNPIFQQNFNDFFNSMSPEGAREKVEELVRTNKMSKEQLEDLKKQAKSFASIMGIQS